jgi:predicted dienelactone hydrolase
MVFKVGLRRLLYEDAGRLNWDKTGPRPLLTDIWYPAAATAEESDVLIGPPATPFLNAGKAARDADLASGLFPLVVLSHGTGGMSFQLGWLASYLASEGYIAAAVNHHGNNALEPYKAQGFLWYWERPRDLTVLLDRLLADPDFATQINATRIGAAGFSLGGYTVLAIAGGVTHIELLIEAFKASGRDVSKIMPPEFPDPAAFAEELESLTGLVSIANASYRDDRVRCVFAIAPALGEAFSPQGLSTVKVPVRLVVGESDQMAPAATNAAYLAKHIKDSELTVLEKVGHYTFLAEATDAGRRELPMFCVDPPDVDRAAVHLSVAKWADEFFAKHLKAA